MLGARNRGLALARTALCLATAGACSSGGDSGDGVAGVIVLAEDVLPQEIEVSDGRVFWSNQEGSSKTLSPIKAVPIDGGEAEIIYDMNRVSTFTIYDRRIYLTNSAFPESVTLDGKDHALLRQDTTMYDPYRIVAGPSGVYWSQAGIWGIDRLGDVPRKLNTDGLTGVSPHLLHGSVLYIEGGVDLYRLDVSPDAIPERLTGPIDPTWGVERRGEYYNPKAVTIDAVYVYWTEGGGRLQRIPKAGGTAELLADDQDFPNPGKVEGTLSNALDLEVDDTHLYWVNSQAAGSLNRMVKTGGEIEILVPDMWWPFALALDGDFIYWTRAGSVLGDDLPGRVYKMRKPPPQ